MVFNQYSDRCGVILETPGPAGDMGQTPDRPNLWFDPRRWWNGRSVETIKILHGRLLRRGHKIHPEEPRQPVLRLYPDVYRR